MSQRTALHASADERADQRDRIGRSGTGGGSRTVARSWLQRDDPDGWAIFARRDESPPPEYPEELVRAIAQGIEDARRRFLASVGFAA